MRALVSLILSSMMINLSVQARSSATSSNNSADQNMEEDQETKNLSPQKMEDAYTGKYPKRKFKGYDKYPKGRLPDSTPQEILQTED